MWHLASSVNSNKNSIQFSTKACTLKLSLNREGLGRAVYRSPRFVAPSEEAAPQQPGPSDASSGPSASSGQPGSSGGTSSSSGAGPQPDSQRKRAREEDSESDSGVISAKPNNVLNKYNTGFSLPCERIFGSVSDLPKDLIAPAFSNSSWRAMESAWNNFKAFENFSDQAISFPLDQKTVNNLIIWLFKNKKLRHLSIFIYSVYCKVYCTVLYQVK